MTTFRDQVERAFLDAASALGVHGTLGHAASLPDPPADEWISVHVMESDDIPDVGVLQIDAYAAKEKRAKALAAEVGALFQTGLKGTFHTSLRTSARGRANGRTKVIASIGFRPVITEPAPVRSIFDDHED